MLLFLPLMILLKNTEVETNNPPDTLKINKDTVWVSQQKIKIEKMNQSYSKLDSTFKTLTKELKK